MKKIFSLLAFLTIAAFVVAQEPVFQSPYKDGSPFPDSLKDYSPTVPINLLEGGSAKANPSIREQKNSSGKGQQAEEKQQPAIFNSDKRKKQ
ncbi:MAG: hypothetical protein KIS94_00275 [Chitinophagales bacterium]|nr:hypothetical protein [Chitinophagales bacterium]